MSSIEASITAPALPPLRVESVASRLTQTSEAVSQKISDVSPAPERVSVNKAEQGGTSAEQIKDVKSRIDGAIGALNEAIKHNANKLEFSVDEISNKMVVVVTDKVTGETVRQVPAEAILRVAHNIEALKGLLLDKLL
jgi:uncharacterized FlaG/YvyC family protein